MPKGYAPSIFVSSTCYDLSQIRADLTTFIEQMGLEPILSEKPAFPALPGVRPVENCVYAVKQRADIFILIIGARYGSVVESGTSITNLEYLEAKAKGVPIYVFVLKRILHILPVWEKNPTSDYSAFVDNPKLFEFIQKIRSSQDHWIYEFENTQDITNILSRQLPLLFMEGLMLRERVHTIKSNPLLDKLKGRALRLLFEKPIAWEYLLFAAVLRDEIEAAQAEEWDYQYEFALHFRGTLQDNELSDWLRKKLDSLNTITDAADKIINNALQVAFGPPGEAGNPSHIVYCATRIARVYQSLLEWSIDCQSVAAHPDCTALLKITSKLSEHAITSIAQMPDEFEKEIHEGIKAHELGIDRENGFVMKLNLSYAEEFSEECRILTQKITARISQESPR